MKFSQIIKKLRLDADMIQERLSELLSISPQAISRWETGIAMPDISLLPPLANLFHVTIDYLLGMDEQERDARRAEYETAYKEYWKMDDKFRDLLGQSIKHNKIVLKNTEVVNYGTMRCTES